MKALVSILAIALALAAVALAVHLVRKARRDQAVLDLWDVIHESKHMEDTVDVP